MNSTSILSICTICSAVALPNYADGTGVMSTKYSQYCIQQISNESKFEKMFSTVLGKLLKFKDLNIYLLSSFKHKD
jgi:hypothetical protein